MIGKILLGIISLITSLIYGILTPIDTIIQNSFPVLSDAINSVGTVFNFISTSIVWAVNLSGLSASCISLIVAYYTFKLSLPLAISGIKLVVKWYIYTYNSHYYRLKFDM